MATTPMLLNPPSGSTKYKALQSFQTLKSFYLPQFSSPLAVSCNPNFLSLGRQADKWLFETQNISDGNARNKMAECRVALFNNLIIPEAGDKEALVCCKYTWIITQMDDLLDFQEINKESEIARYLETSMDILHGNIASLMTIPDHERTRELRALKAWNEVVREMKQFMQPRTFNRFVAAVAGWAECQIHKQKALNKVLESSANATEAFICERRENVFFTPYYPLLEMCLGVSLKDEDLESPDLLAAHMALNDNMWLVNELMSFRKELFYDKELFFKQVRSFLLVLLMTEPGVNTFQDAVNMVCSMVMDTERKFFYHMDAATQKAKECGNHDLLHYLTALARMVAGGIYWQTMSPRYHGMNNPFINGQLNPLPSNNDPLVFGQLKPFYGTWYLNEQWTIVVDNPTTVRSCLLDI